MISKRRKNKYLENPYVCPFCGSSDISAGEREAVESELSQRVDCNNKGCNKSWKEFYQLADIEEIDE